MFIRQCRARRIEGWYSELSWDPEQNEPPDQSERSEPTIRGRPQPQDRPQLASARDPQSLPSPGADGAPRPLLAGWITWSAGRVTAAFFGHRPRVSVLWIREHHPGTHARSGRVHPNHNPGHDRHHLPDAASARLWRDLQRPRTSAPAACRRPRIPAAPSPCPLLGCGDGHRGPCERSGNRSAATATLRSMRPPGSWERCFSPLPHRQACSQRECARAKILYASAMWT